MCKNASELMNLVDEMAASAACVQGGSQNYDNFIRTRELLKQKVQYQFDKNHLLTQAIKHLNTLI